jgi:hypothetical protein
MCICGHRLGEHPQVHTGSSATCKHPGVVRSVIGARTGGAAARSFRNERKGNMSTDGSEITEALNSVLCDVERERDRQEALKRAGKFKWSCADSSIAAANHTATDALGNAAKFAVLGEEFGEVARHITEALIDGYRYNNRELKKELIQVAAVCVAWVEAIDRELDAGSL